MAPVVFANFPLFPELADCVDLWKNDDRFRQQSTPMDEFVFEPEVRVKLEAEDSPALLATRHCLMGCAVPGCRG